MEKLVLHGCQLSSANPAILASAAATVRTVHLDQARLDPKQVAELLRKSSTSKSLNYLTLDGVAVPEELLGAEEVLNLTRRKFNIYIEGGRKATLTSVIQ